MKNNFVKGLQQTVKETAEGKRKTKKLDKNVNLFKPTGNNIQPEVNEKLCDSITKGGQEQLLAKFDNYLLSNGIEINKDNANEMVGGIE